MLVKSSFITQQCKPTPSTLFLRQSSLHPFALKTWKAQSLLVHILHSCMNETKEIAFESLSYTLSSSELYLPKSISVPDTLFDYKTLTQGWREGGVCCAMGKFQKLPNQMAVAQRDIRSFQVVPLQQKSHHWPSSCWTPLLGSLSRPFCHFAKGNLCNKCLNTQLEQMVMCMLACHQSSEKPDMQQLPYFKKARLFLIPASLQQDLILEIWMKVT